MTHSLACHWGAAVVCSALDNPPHPNGGVTAGYVRLQSSGNKVFDIFSSPIIDYVSWNCNKVAK
jgi:hypothetical protein